MFAALSAALRNPDIRRVELAWGAAVARRVGALRRTRRLRLRTGRRRQPSGSPGLCACCRRRSSPPFAASFGDRFRRERFLLALTLVGSLALGGSAAAAFADAELLVFAFAALVGLAFTLIRPTLQALLPSLARTPAELIASNGATSTIESLGTLLGPLLAGVLVSVADVGLVFAVGAGEGFFWPQCSLLRVRIEGGIDLGCGHRRRGRRDDGSLRPGFERLRAAQDPAWSSALIVAQTFVRGCLNVLIVVAAFQVFDAGAEAVGYMTAAIGVGGLIGAFGAMTLGGRRLAVAFGLALVFLGSCRSRSSPRGPTSRRRSSCSRSSAPPIASRTWPRHPAPADRPE